MKHYIETCHKCSTRKKTSRKGKCPLTLYHAGEPMERVHIDFLGPLTKSKRGNEYILVMVDQFTKWVEIVPLPSQTAEVTAKAVIDNFFSKFGYPFQIHSDQGKNFESKLFRSICDLLQIHKSRTTPYRPQANGQVERYNRTLMDAVRCYIDKSPNEWDEYLQQLSGALRSSLNRSTGYTPNMLMLGREVNQPVDLIFKTPSNNEVNLDEYSKKFKEAVLSAHDTAREKLHTSQRKMKRDYDIKVLEKSYKVGDLVYILDKTTVQGTSRKLRVPWKGPVVVIEKITPYMYKVRNNHKEIVVIHDMIKICKDRELPRWASIYRSRQQSGNNTITSPPRQVKQKTRGETVYCVGKQPHGGRFMIQCDLCYEWYHGDCVNVTQEEASDINTYYCPLCGVDDD